MKNKKSPPLPRMGIISIAILLIVVVSFNACKKQEVSKSNTDIETLERAVINTGKTNFVFSVKNIQKALNKVATQKKFRVPVTHLYIKMKPTTASHYQAIEKQQIPAYPFPLATEYLDASKPDYTTLYTFLPINKKLPNCPLEILDSVCLLNPESPLAALAYKEAGKESKLSAAASMKQAEANVARLNSIEEVIPCDAWASTSNNDGYTQPDYYEELTPCIDCDCDYNPPPPPPPPPAPVVLNPADPRPVPTTVTYNSCSMNTDDNYPSGRISVQETQWGANTHEGVADVKIEILGPGGQRIVTQTNRYGCFKASSAIRGFKLPFGIRLPVLMNVIFESGRKEIRGLNDFILAEYALPLKHIYGDIAYKMNSANVVYNLSTSISDNSTKYYVAATVNNALYEYDEYAMQDGISAPMDNIKILVHRYASSGSTPMFNAMRHSHPFEYFTIKGFFDATTAGLGPLISNTPPDVTIGYDYNSVNHFATDQIKETAYHEFAHASHYNIASFQFWVDNINFVTHYGGYGNAGDNGVEKTDLIEMWGYFMGREYAHRRYGPNAHSALLGYYNTTDASPATFLNSWYAVNENRGNKEDSRFESNGHIAACFLHDIVDDNLYHQSLAAPRLNESNNVVDRVRGYSISTIFNNMHSGTTSASQLINNLRGNLPSNNTLLDYDSLRFGYGY